MKWKSNGLWGLILSLVLLCSCIPMNTFAATTTITELEVFDLELPVAGKMADFDVSVPEDAGYEVYDWDLYGCKNGVSWYDMKAEENVDPETGTFIGGREYCFTVILKAKEWFEFADQLQLACNLNGQAISDKANGFGNYDQKQYICFNCYFDVDEQYITSIAINDVQAPKGGELPSMACSISEGSGCSINGINWYDENGQVMGSGKTFEAGKQYTIGIDLLPKEGYLSGYEYGFTVNGTLNGERADVISSGSNLLRLEYRFGPAAEADKKENPFKDVKEDDYYFEPVLWAVDNEVTKGLSEDTFGPGENCTRGQVVTFLWRAAGCPEPQSNQNQFSDVKNGDYFYKAVLWAVEQEITMGVGGNRFAPGESCTRGQIVTFLWRFAEEPMPARDMKIFTDIEQGAYYYKAVLWAVEQGITMGTSNTTFSPEDICTRGQIVTFLHRYVR